MSLSIKQMSEDPWSTIENKFLKAAVTQAWLKTSLLMECL